MKITSRAFFLLLLIQTSTVLPRTQDAPNGIIDGVVLDSLTNLPVSGVNVSVRDSAAPEKLTPTNYRAPSPIPGATTDSAGRFSISGLKLVSYRLTAWADGYVDVNLGSNVTTNLDAPISLNSAQAVKHLVIHISRSATLTGQILDDRGRPATNLVITAFKLIYNKDGFPAEGSPKRVETDDRGEYRLYGMAPGRYYLRAGDLYVPATPYAMTYYPNARTIEIASEIDLKAGAEVRLNWIVNHERMFSVGGRIIDDATQNSPSNAGLAMAVCSEFFSPGVSLSTSWYQPTTGKFVLSNIRPGRYLLVVGIPNATPMLVNSIERLASAEALIEVKDQDIDNLVLRLASPVSLPGKVRYEGTTPVPLNDLLSLRLLMNRVVPPGIQCGTVSGAGPLFKSAGPEPAFHVGGLMIDQDYRVQATGTRPDMYVAKILYSGKDVTNDVIHIFDGKRESIEVILHFGAGMIHGEVKRSDGSSAAGALTVLVPKQRDRRDLYYRAIVDESGSYSIEGVTPGDYQLFSFMTNDPFLYFNPRIMKNYESVGRDVTVTDFSNQGIDLNVIREDTN